MNDTLPNAAELEKHLSSKSLLVVGLASDCGRTIEADVMRLLAALEYFKSLSWLVIESDSVDDTLDVLTRLNATIPNFRFLSLGTLCDKIPLRTERIAHCRNQYLMGNDSISPWRPTMRHGWGCAMGAVRRVSPC